MKKIYSFLILIAATFTPFLIQAQSSANYAFSTSTTGSLAADMNANVVDMTTGTTQVSGSSVDQGVNASAINIGFDFWLMGNRYSQFNVTTNGLVSLSSTGTSATGGTYIVSGGTVTTPIISAFAADLGTGTSGKTHYKLVGTAPNRTLVIEFSNMTLTWTSSYTNDGTYQVRLYESTGVIEFVYGTMSITTNASASDATVAIGFATNSTTNNLAYITSSTNTNSVTAPFTDNTAYATGPITNLNSAANGSRRVYSYAPPAPDAAPTGLSFTGVTGSGVTLNWTDNATNELAYAVYRSTDGINYTYATQAAANATSVAVTGLSFGTTYFFRLYAVTEGALSTALSGSQATNAGTLSGIKTVGAGGNYTNLTTAFADINTNGLAGNVDLQLITGYPAVAETFPISTSTASSVGTFSVNVYPTVSGLTITGSSATGLLNFNNGTRITFDGRVNATGSTKDLTISNTNTGTGAYAAQFINDATSNTLKFCILKSLNASTSSGIVVLGTSTGTTGNDNNTFDNCDFDGGAAATASPTTTPANGIYSVGSTGTSALYNSGMDVKSCNFINIFNAGLATNNILAGTGNSDWTIRANNFYQTAVRTTTASNTYTGINVNYTSGNNFSVTDNFIGGSAASATGTAWTITNSTFTNRYIGISLAAGTTTASSIQNNTIANFSVGTNSSAATANGNFCGIFSSAGNVNIGTVTGNTIGSTTGNGSITVTLATNSGGTANLLAYSGTGIVDIRNNNIGSVNLLGSTTSIAEGFNGIYVSGGTPTIMNNTIGSNATANSINSSTATTAATVQALTGIQITSGVTVPATISGNIIANMNGASVSTASTVRGIFYNGTGATSIINNTVHDLTGATANTTVSGAATGVQGIVYTGTSPAGGSVSQNTVYTISATNTGAVATVSSGIGYSNPTNGSVTRNKIYDIRNASTGVTATTPPMAIGLLIRASLTSGTFANNMISLGTGQTTNTQFVGIMNSFLTNTINIHYNSIHIDGTAASGALPSFCFLRGDNSGTAVATPVDIKNNIFNNVRTGGTGKHYAIANQSTVASTTGWGANASNFNALNSSAATIGLWGAADQTFAAWKTSSAGDGNSVSNTPVTFTATATADLHLNMGVTPTPLESGGTTLATTIDYDNQNRPGPAGSVNGGATAPDLGADEFDGVTSDIVTPTIVYTPFSFTCSTGNRTLTATITDASGVPTAGAGLPVLYFKINAGSYSPVTGVSIGSNQYTFTFGSGVTAGDVVSYYVAAQDNAPTPNVGVSPATGAAGFTANPPAAATPPTSPSTYSVSSSLSGVYNVGSGGNFATLTAAFAAYNTSCLSGPVTFLLTDAAYSNTSDTLKANADASAVNTLTIKPKLANTTITGNTTAATIVLQSADYITIDGSVAATTNSVCPPSASARDLTILNSNASAVSAVIWLTGVGADGANNNNISNCNIAGSGPTATLIGLGGGGTTIGSPPTTYSLNNNTYINNNISNVQIGIYSAGISAATKNTGTVINQNLINTASPNNVSRGGIAAFSENGIQISGNNVSGMNLAGSPDVFGINLLSLSISTSTTTGIESTNATITNNIIGTVKNTGTFSAAGILLAPGASGTSVIANNMLNGVSANGTSGDFGVGIFVTPLDGSVTKIYYNTVSMSGTQSGGSDKSYSLAVAGGTTPTLDIKNNIFSNTQNNGTGLNYAIGLGYTTFTNITSDNNDLYTTTGALYATGATASISSPTNRVTLANWQTATSKDAASVSALPVFVSPTNLHLVSPDANNLANLESKGVAVTVTSDIDCETRPNGSAPDLGADEFVGAMPTCATPTGVSAGTITGSSAVITWTASGTSILEYGPAATFTTPGTGATAGPGGTIFTPGPPTSPTTLTGLASNTTYNVFVRTDCTGAALGYSNNTPVVSFTTLIGNDDATGATLLTLGSGCTGSPYTTVGATASATEPFPSCSGTKVSPVWFKFVAPASGAVRISTDITAGTLTDTKVGLFSATDVNDYTTFSIISCDDDGGSAFGSGFLSVVYATGLTGGTTYYVAVDRYSSSTTAGTFCIAVDELNSTMLSTTNTCASTYQTPINNSNTTYTGWFPLLDGSSKLIALARKASGIAVSALAPQQNINSGAVRNTGGVYYLDRNFRIASTETNVDVQFFFLNSELAALTAVDPAANISTLGGAKQTDGGTCRNNFATTNGAFTPFNQTSNGGAGVNGVNWITTNVASFSNFYLFNAAAVVPVTIEYFRGSKQPAGNYLDWKVTCTSAPSVVIALERSGDGNNFAEINSENASAVRCQQGFNYTDNKPLSGVNYYRLKLTTPNGQFRYSNVITLLNAAGSFDVTSIAPNPVKSSTMVTMVSSKAGKVTIAVSDLAGKVVVKQSASVIAGTNSINLELSNLAAGTYQVVVVNEAGEKKAIRFVKL